MDASEYKGKALTNPTSTFGVCIELWRAQPVDLDSFPSCPWSFW